VLEDLIRAWDGEEVVVHFDDPSGSWMFVCVPPLSVVLAASTKEA
jgi:hypothetical protein